MLCDFETIYNYVRVLRTYKIIIVSILVINITVS